MRERVLGRLQRRFPGMSHDILQPWVTEMEKLLVLKAEAQDTDATVLSPSGAVLSNCDAVFFLCLCFESADLGQGALGACAAAQHCMCAW